MEWVEITARTLEEARETAVDQLGVDEADAEIEVIEEPRAGLFGRMRGQARVRARVRPTAPRPKAERRERRKRRDGEVTRAGTEQGGPTTVAVGADSPEQTEGEPQGDGGRRRRPRSRSGGGGGERRPPAERPQKQEGTSMPELTIDEQATLVGSFLTELADAFGVAGTSVESVRADEETMEIRLTGGELGLLVGPKGQTLQAVQELARTMVQRRGGGTQEGRIRIDIAGYRERRRAALERFTSQVADEVLASGRPKALEPMNAADRKVVHDAANSIDGVRTTSEGEEPRRRVVVLPAE